MGLLERLSLGSAINLEVPPLRALIYAQDRSRNARLIADEIKAEFNTSIDGKNQILNTVIPYAKAYLEASTYRIPVHCHEREHAGKSESALSVMTSLVYELFPPIKDQQLKGTFFNNMADLYSEYGTEEPETDTAGE